MVLPKAADAKALGRVPHLDALQRALSRRKKKWADLASGPVTVELPDGALAAWVVRDAAKSMFEQQTALRKAVQSVLAENPRDLGIAVFGDAGERAAAAALAAYFAWANGARLASAQENANALPQAADTPVRCALTRARYAACVPVRIQR